MEKEKIKSFTDLNAWQASHRLVLMIYKTTQKFPKEELFGLVTQMRRSAVSIVSNIAEGFSRNTQKEKLQFYAIARGSLTELQSQLLIARDIQIISNQEFAALAEAATNAHKLVNGLCRYLKESAY